MLHYYFRKVYVKAVKMNNWLLTMITISFFAITSFVVSYIEPETFPNAFEGLWWAMTTATTVGYGDVSPTTVSGKIFTILFVYPVGGVIAGTLLAKIADFVVSIKKKREEGRMAYKGKNHFVFINWSNGKTKKAIEEVLHSNKNADLVLIDTLEKTPMEHDRFHYIRGDATENETLEQANVHKAKNVSIFAPEDATDVKLADGQTLLIATSIEAFGIEKGIEIQTTVEILKESHIRNFKNAKIEQYVISEQGISSLIAKAALYPGSIKLLNQMLSTNKRHGEYDLHPIKPKKDWKTYKDAKEYLEKHNANLISNKDDMGILSKLNENIPNDALLFVTCDEKTYENLK